MVVGPDAEKFNAEWSMRLDNFDSDLSKLNNIGQFVGTVGGMAADYIAFNFATKGVVSSLGSKMFSRFIKNMKGTKREPLYNLLQKNSMIRSMFHGGSAAIVDAGFDGAFEVARQNVIGMFSGRDDMITDSVGEVAKAYGIGAAFDLSIGLAASTLIPFMATSTRTLHKRFGKVNVNEQDFVTGISDSLEKLQDPTQLYAIKEPLRREAMLAKNENLQSIRDFAKSRGAEGAIDQIRAAREAGEDLSQLKVKRYQVETINRLHEDPVLELKVNALSGGSAVKRLDDGKYKIFHMDPESGKYVAKTARNFGEAQSQISELSRASGYTSLSKEYWGATTRVNAMHAHAPRQAQHLYTQSYEAGNLFGKGETDKTLQSMWKDKGILPTARRQYIGEQEIDDVLNRMDERVKALEGAEFPAHHAEFNYKNSRAFFLGEDNFPSNSKTRVYKQLQSPGKKEYKLFYEQTADINLVKGVKTSRESASGFGVMVNPAPQGRIDEAYAEARKMVRNGMNDGLSADQLARNELISHGFDGMVDSTGTPSFFFPDQQIKYIMPDVADNGLPRSGIPKEDSLFKDVNATIKSNRIADIDPDYIRKDSGRMVRAFDAIHKAYDENPDGAVRALNKIIGGEKQPDVLFKDVKGKKYINIGTSSIAEDEFIKNPRRAYTMFKNQQAIVSGKKSSWTKDAKTYVRNSETYARPPQNERISKWNHTNIDAFLGSNSKKLQNVGHEVGRLQLKGEYWKAMDVILNERVNFSTAKKIFESQGFKFIKQKGGKYIAKGPSATYSGDTPYQALKNAGISDFRLPKELGPKSVGVSPEGKIRIEWGENNVVSAESKSEILRILNSFEDYSKTSLQTPIGKITVQGDKASGNLVRNADDTVQLEMEGAGINREFADIGEAKRFANEWYKNFSDLELTARRRGIKISYDPGGPKWEVYDGSSTQVVDNIEDLNSVLKKFPEMNDPPNMLDSLDPSIEADVKYVVDRMKKQIAGTMGATGYDFWDAPLKGGDDAAREAVKKKTRELLEEGQPMDKVIEPLQMRLGSMRQVTKNIYDKGHTHLAELLDEVDSNVQVFRKQVEEFRVQLDEVFKKSNGKVMDQYERPIVRRYLESRYSKTEDDFWKSHPKANKDDIVTSANRLTELYGNTPFEGLSVQFGIPLNKFVFDYVPRQLLHIDRLEEFKKAINSVNNTEDLLKHTKANLQKGIPKDLDIAAKKFRTQELASVLTDQDPYSVTMKYIEAGLRDNLMGAQWKQIYKYVDDNAVDLGPDIIQRLNLYRETLTGSYLPQGEKAISEFIGRLRYKNWIKNNKKLLDQAVKDGQITEFERDLSLVSKDTEAIGRDTIRVMYSLNYFTNMSFRPWLALRNTYQIFTTLGARFGLSNVTESIREIHKNPQYWYDIARQNGVLRSAPPVGVEISDTKSAVGEMLRKGLWMFANSDDYTRAIAFVTARKGLENAIDAQRLGRINPAVDGWDNFDSISKLEMDHTMGREQVHRLVNESGIFGDSPVNDEILESAKTLWGRRVALETMFDYDPTNKPSLFQNTYLGKLFGMYGTYSVGYRENMLNALKYANPKARRGFVFRFLGIHAALFGAFTAAGINASNFLPGFPALFSGGPLYGVATKAINSINPTYDGRESLYELNRLFSPISIKDGSLEAQYPMLAPGSLQYKYLTDAIESFNDGDIYRGFMNLNSFPMKDPNDGWFP